MTHTIGRTGRRLLFGSLPVFALLLAAPAVPVAAGGGSTSTLITAKTSVSGLPQPFKLQITGYNDGSFEQIGLLLTSWSPDHKSAAWTQWDVCNASVGCSAKFAACHVASAAVMGTYGTIDLTFKPTGPLVVNKHYCQDGTTLSSVGRTRSGKLTGTFRLRTQTSYFGTIRNGHGAHRIKAVLPAVASDTTYVAPCPVQPVKQAGANCEPAYMLRATGGYLITRSANTGRSSFVMFLLGASGDPDVEIMHAVFAKGAGKSVLTISNTGGALKGATSVIPKNPYVSGKVTFESHGQLTTKADSCPTDERPGSIEASITLHVPGYPGLTAPKHDSGYLDHLKS